MDLRDPGGPQKTPMDGAGTAVVYVHGLWWNGRESWLLGRRLAAWHGWRTHVFPYASMHEHLDEVAARLRRFLDALGAQGAGPARIHLLGHSLGGLVILHCLRQHPWSLPGRAVFMGTPANGAQVAHGLGRSRVGGRLLGTVLPEALAADVPQWDVDRELGLIAGTASFGPGHLVVKFDGPNDGTVSVAETRLQGATAHLAMPVTHMGMLLSARVAREVGSLFEHGHFN